MFCVWGLDMQEDDNAGDDDGDDDGNDDDGMPLLRFAVSQQSAILKNMKMMEAQGLFPFCRH